MKQERAPKRPATRELPKTAARGKPIPRTGTRVRSKPPHPLPKTTPASPRSATPGKPPLSEDRQPAGPRGPLIVGVGASAGGLDAMKAFLRGAPPRAGLAFVLVQHLDPTHKSLMTEILATNAKVRVETAADGVKIRPGHLYVGPPGSDVTIHAGVLRLTAVTEIRGHHFPIDTLLRSLAQDQGERAVGVILSGTGTDGTLGIQAIKANGGTVLVQDPKTAGFDGMPKSAIATGLVDIILPAEELAAQIAGFARHPYVRAAPDPDSTEPASLEGVLSILRVRNGYDFRPYKDLTLHRRIHRRMGLKSITKVEDYARLLRSDPQELSQLQNDLLISVTGFFRDPDAFKQLKSAIPSLLEESEEPTHMRAWVAGCATGEEAYSVAMVLLDALAGGATGTSLQVFASDVNKDALTVARTGTYNASALNDVPGHLRARYFTKIDDEHYRAKKEMRQTLVFSDHNVLVDPPFFKLDLISCRNLLIYLKPEAQKRVHSLFHAALKPGGILFLGSSETVPPGSGFETVNAKARIYRRVGPPARMALLTPPSQDATLPAQAPAERHERRARSSREPSRIEEVAREWLLETYAPASVVVDPADQIVYLHGPVGNYLDLPRGAARFDLMSMPRQGLSARLRVAVHTAKRKKRAVTIEGVLIRRNGGTHAINVHVKPAPSPPFAEGVILVTFEEARATPAGRNKKGARTQRGRAHEKEEALVEQLEAELAATKADLQATIETMETANEELKASNEEMMSINEEFRSTNEELETSKEELQSLNEELQSVNSQLKDKQESLEAANDDLLNLFSSSRVATLFLDREQRITRFTPAIRELYTLTSSDVGRALTDFSPKFADSELPSDMLKVLNTQSVLERTIRTSEGKWFLRRVQRYLTQDGHVAGTVVTFTDVDALKTLERSARRAKKYSQNVVETIQTPLLVVDEDLRVKTANAAFYDAFRTLPDQTIGKLVYDLGSGQWDHPQLRKLLQEIIPRGEEVRNFQVDATFESIGKRSMLLSAKAIRIAEEGQEEDEEEEEEEEEEGLILLAIEDVTERRAAEAARARALAERLEAERASNQVAQRFQLLIQGAREYAILMLDPAGTVTTWSDGAERITGYKADEIIGRNFGVFYKEEDRARGHPTEVIRDAEVHGQHDEEGWRVRKNGAHFLAQTSLNAIYDEDGHVTAFMKIMRDITRRERDAAAIREHAAQVEAKNRTLQQTNESLDAFSYVVGHDLKEPTRAVEHVFSIIAEDHKTDLPSDVQDLLAKGRAANLRLARLVTGLLNYGRASRADLGARETLAIGDVLRMEDCVARYRDRFEERGARLEYPDPGIVVHAHAQALCQVLGNLLDNAVKHNPNAEPTVRVIARNAQDGKSVEITIEDNGPGLPPDVLAGFEDRRAATRGFGIVIAKRLVELMGGKLALGQTSDGGGAVRITLPTRAPGDASS